MRDESIESRELDVLLEEVLGGVAPPDLADEIIRRHRSHWDGPRTVQRRGERSQRSLLFAAMIGIAVVIVATWLRVRGPAAESGTPAMEPITSVGERPVGEQDLRIILVEDRDDVDAIAVSADEAIGIRAKGGWRHSTFDDELLAHVVKRLPGIRYLDITQTRVTSAGLSALRGLAKLTRIDARDCAIGDAGFAHLVAMPNLRVLRLGSDHEAIESITDAGLEILARAPSLERLELPFCNEITDEGIVRLATSRSLRSLNIDGAVDVGDRAYHALAQAGTLREFSHRRHRARRVISDDGIRALARLDGLTLLRLGSGASVTGYAFEPFANSRLRVVWLSGFPSLGNDALKHLATCPGLEELNILQCASISDVGIGHLVDASALRRLSITCRGSPGLTDAGLQFLGRMRLLEVLDVTYCQALTDQGARALSSLTRLRLLGLRANIGIGDPGVASFTALRDLETLILDRLPVTDRSLAELSTLPRLRTLGLRGCEEVTQEGIDAFAKANPACAIQR